MPSRVKLLKSRGLFLALSITSLLIIATYPVLLEPNLMVVVNELRVGSRELPKCFNGFKVLHLTDLHFGSRIGNWRLGIRDSIVLEIVRRSRPDVIVVTGDLISTEDALPEGLKFMEELVRIAETYYVPGNWDYWSGAGEELINSLRRLGVKVLLNEHVIIRRGCGEVYIAGVDDPFTFRSNLSKALHGLSEDDFVILLAHSPEVVGGGVGLADLILAGHTHGGQVVLPVVGPLFVPLPPGYRRYVSGVFKLNNTLMVVNRGVGTSILPIRFLCPPEVVLIELVTSPTD